MKRLLAEGAMYQKFKNWVYFYFILLYCIALHFFTPKRVLIRVSNDEGTSTKDFKRYLHPIFLYGHLWHIGTFKHVQWHNSKGQKAWAPIAWSIQHLCIFFLFIVPFSRYSPLMDIFVQTIYEFEASNSSS